MGESATEVPYLNPVLSHIAGHGEKQRCSPGWAKEIRHLGSERDWITSDTGNWTVSWDCGSAVDPLD